MTRKDDYAVGYGRPPDSGKIKKGEVRNAAGRRGKNKKKDPENFWEIVLEELDRRMPVSVNGKRKKASPNQLGAVQFARRIAEGDPKATRDLLTICATWAAGSKRHLVPASSKRLPTS